MRLAAGLLGELERSPRPLAAIGGCLLLRGEGREGEKGRTGIGRGKGGRGGKGGKGRGGEGREGEGEKRKDDLHPTLFLGPAAVWPNCAVL